MFYASNENIPVYLWFSLIFANSRILYSFRKEVCSPKLHKSTISPQSGAKREALGSRFVTLTASCKRAQKSFITGVYITQQQVRDTVALCD